MKKNIRKSNDSKRYWFKRRLSGWVIVPIKWQGWIVMIIGILFGFAGIYVGDTDDAPGAAFLGILFMIAIIFSSVFLKGKKVHCRYF